MNVRTTETTVTFRRPFMLSALDCPQPAGTYRLVTEEEQIEGLSFVAFQRVATLLHTPAISARSGGTHQVFVVDLVELETALKADAGA
jgi:hypothetical protein